MPSTLALEIAAAFEHADWHHSEVTAADTLGTSLFLHGRMLGGSIRVYNDTIVRFLAFNGLEVPEGREAAINELMATANPSLLIGTLEVDPALGVVCRVSLDVAALLTPTGSVSAPESFYKLIVDLASAATAVLDQFAPVIEAVSAGSPVAEALKAAQPVG
jgi:hypothetical protein